MRNTLYNFISNRKKLNLYTAHLLLLLIPFHSRLVVYALILFLVTNLFAHSFSARVHYYKKRKHFILLFSLFYLIHIVAVFYSDNISEALFDLEIKLSMLLVPWVVLTSHVINKYTLPALLRTFIYGAVAAAIISFIYAGILYNKTGNPDAFYYGELAYYHHPGYFAMYLNFAVSALMIFIFNKRNRVRIYHYIMLLFLIVSVYQLSSRMGIIVLGFLLAYALVYFVYPRIKYKNPLTALFAVLILASTFVYFSIEHIDRFKNLKTNIAQKKTDASGPVRLSLWKASLIAIGEKPVFGHGTGDVKTVLFKKYDELGVKSAADKQLNAHNQFLQTGVGAGIIGMLCLILPMMIPLLYLRKKRNFLYGLFIFNIAMNALTESVFERQDGVVFYAIMNAFLYFTYRD